MHHDTIPLYSVAISLAGIYVAWRFADEEHPLLGTLVMVLCIVNILFGGII
jgi:hypothetical protein